MKSVIRLDDFTINRIAAGEVVERPAAAVKELVENSIDAHASAITIEIEQGGLRLIKVIDNGHGMDQSDIEIAFQRHTTSKISEFDDLQSVKTMGFRGEALASITSVAMVEMVTRTKDSMGGHQIVVNGGNVESLREVGCPPGTTITVKNIFYNAPARKKFIKSTRAESAAISDLIAKLILANPELSIKYVNNKKLIYHSPGNGKIFDTAYSIYGNEIKDNCISFKETYHNITFSGCLGDTALLGANRNHQVFVVNGRLVHSPLVSRAIERGYEDYLMVRQYPWVIMFIEIDPSNIDVNVHPQKITIKFDNEQLIIETVQLLVKKLLDDKHTIPKVNPYVFEKVREPIKAKESDETDAYLDKKVAILKNIAKQNEPLIDDVFLLEKDDLEADVSLDLLNKEVIEEVEMLSFDSLISDGEHKKNLFTLDQINLIGALFDTYILIELAQSIYIIDQHAAHERLIYETLKESINLDNPPAQLLLIPFIYHARYDEGEKILAHQDRFQSLGFEIEQFGNNDIIVRSVPNILKDINIKEFFTSLFKEVSDEIDPLFKSNDVLLKRLTTTACKKAIKANDKLSETEILNLLNEMNQATMPLTCPHGRPIIVELTKKDMEKMFKRIV